LVDVPLGSEQSGHLRRALRQLKISIQMLLYFGYARSDEHLLLRIKFGLKTGSLGLIGEGYHNLFL